MSSTGPSSSSSAPGPSSSGHAGASGTAALQSDTSLWLHNKLGTSNDSWTGGSIVSQLNPDILSKIQGCFQDLQPQVKLKLLLSLFHIPRRNLEIWRSKLEAILDVAKEDSEPWVCMLAELMKTYPASGQLASDVAVPDANRKIFHDLAADLRKALRKSDQAEQVLPLECHFLNKNAFISAVGHMPQTQKHFTLKRKPKAAALKAELMNKSQDAANKVKSSSGGNFPMRKSTMPRKMTSADLKGLPSRTLGTAAGFRNQNRPNLPNRNVRKPEGGGVKLLDINEQPLGFAQAKKRKRQQELEEQQAEKEQRKRDQENRAKEMQQHQQENNANSNNKDSSRGRMPGAGGAAGGGGDKTPSYAPGLASLPPPSYAPPTPTPLQPPAAPPAPLPPPPQVVSSGPPPLVAASSTAAASAPPSYAPPRPTVTAVAPPSAATASVTLGRGPPPGVALPTAPVPPGPPSASAAAPASSAPFPAGLSTLEPLPPTTVRTVTLPPSYNPNMLPKNPMPAQAGTGGSGPRLVQLPTQPIPRLPTQPSPVVRPVRAAGSGPPASVLGAALQQQQQQQQQQQPRLIQQRNIRPPSQVGAAATAGPSPPVAATSAASAQPTPPQRKSLTLTREQALEAQEMFRTANKVTRPEKALILGFMAGSRDNPCPHLGNVVTIKLSENQENVLQTDQTYLTMIVETHFQMNYSSGQWTRIKKYRRLEDA